MNLFAQRFEWHPRFRRAHFSNQFSRFLSELEFHLVDVMAEQALQAFLAQSQTLAEYGLQAGADQVLYLHQQIRQFLSAGYIRPKGQGELQQYHTPDFLTEPRCLTSSASGHAVWVLSDYPELARFIQKLEHLPLSLVLVDDYFDPRLAALNQSFRARNAPWLLLQLSGEHARIGPIFSGGEDGACWQCLHQRMRANSALRWLQCGEGEAQQADFPTDLANPVPPVLAIPVLYDAQRIEQQSQAALALIEKMLAEHIENQFYEINLQMAQQVAGTVAQPTAYPTAHPIIKRPQCPCCGDADFMKNQNRQPVLLKPCAKLLSKDGGVRGVAAEETSRKLQALISPVSGLLSHFHTLSSSDENANKIYRSGFFQCPRRLDALTHQLSNTTFHYVTMGKGISLAQSQASALSEGIERLAAQYQGDELVICKVAEPGDADYFFPQQLSPFSETQYQAFAATEYGHLVSAALYKEHQLYAAAKYHPDQALHWAPVWSLTHERQRWVPFSYCYANTPFPDHIFSRFYHNGGAAGNSLEEAVLQGMLEVIERDAIAIWWYNQTPRAALDFSAVSADLQRQLNHTLGAEWDYWALDISTDFAIPVIAAISRHKTSQQFCLGFGCHIDPVIACQRALTELCQIIEIRHKNTAPFDFTAIAANPYLFPHPQLAVRTLAQLPQVWHADIRDDILHCLEQARRLGLEVLVLNYTRPDMVLATAKVIVPGACHLFPYFAASRLYHVPVAMGLLDQPKTEDQMNPQAILI
jgi:oxazoline/thiazoline synthase